jgi:transposase InsO family protein
MGTPEIFNSDQGSQFTSRPFTGMLADAGILTLQRKFCSRRS